jgi:putative flippase GtrA
MLGDDDLTPTADGVLALAQPHLLSGQDWPSALSTAEVDRLVRAAFGFNAFNLKRTVAKLIRYGATSAIALVISEVALLIAAAFGVTATLAAVIGNLAGIVPSYVMSRYWIWPGAERNRVGRQVIQYWMTSLVSMTITSLATGGISAIAPSSGIDHLFVVGGGFLAINFVCWVGKYIVYQRFIFVEAPALE